jgi:hypothetical protein
MSRSIAAVFAQPSFPDCTGIVEAKRSLPDRAEHRRRIGAVVGKWAPSRAKTSARAALTGPSPPGA